MGLFDYFFKPSTQSSFAELLIQRLHDAGETKEIEYDEESFQLRLFDDGEEAGLVNLCNLYAEFNQLDDSESEQFFSRVTKALLSYQKEVPDEYADAKPDIRPVVRSRAYFELLRLEQQYRGAEPLELPYVEIGNHLLAAPVYDLPESLRTLDAEMLRDWDVSLYEVMETAQANLEEVECVVTVIEDRVYLYSSGDSYDASRLMLTDRLAEMDFQGKPIAMLPNRDSLILTGSDDLKGLQIMLDMAEGTFNNPRPISGTALCFQEGHWETWLPDADHPYYARFLHLHHQSLAGEYHEQKSMLDQVFEEEEIDLFVASYFVISREDSGQLISYAVWSKGVQALLPETDYVFFLDKTDGSIAASATWEKVREIVGTLMTDLDTYPPRFQVEEFPTPTQIEQLGIDADLKLDE
ncbi:MAG: hypothetical protein COA78_12860 [Blastopirellula sp.]|nr:MAG: hypothetical protein COA78_12860 [Blastopirellula sp.]